jgi:hypothetical protein
VPAEGSVNGHFVLGMRVGARMATAIRATSSGLVVP